MTSEKQRKEIREWLQLAISEDFTKYRNKTPLMGELPFSTKLLHYKSHVRAHGFDMNMSDFSASAAMPYPEAGGDTHQEKRTHKQKFFEALIEVRTGGYHLTPKLYHELQTSDKTLHVKGEIKDYSTYAIAQSRPMAALRKTSYEEFKEILNEVLVGYHLPTELKPKNYISKNGAVVESPVRDETIAK